MVVWPLRLEAAPGVGVVVESLEPLRAGIAALIAALPRRTALSWSSTVGGVSYVMMHSFILPIGRYSVGKMDG